VPDNSQITTVEAPILDQRVQPETSQRHRTGRVRGDRQHNNPDHVPHQGEVLQNKATAQQHSTALPSNGHPGSVTDPATTPHTPAPAGADQPIQGLTPTAVPLLLNPGTHATAASKADRIRAEHAARAEFITRQRGTR